MAEKGWDQDGFKGLMLLRGTYDVRTGATLLQTYTEVVSPPSIRSVHDVVPKLNAWEVKLGNLRENYQEELSNRLGPAGQKGIMKQAWPGWPRRNYETGSARLAKEEL